MHNPEIPDNILDKVIEIMATIHTLKIDIEDFPKEEFDYSFREEFQGILDNIDRGKELPELSNKDLEKVDSMILEFEKITATIFKNPPEMVLTHGDITGGNILETEDGVIKLLDWDEAKIAPKEKDINCLNDHPSFSSEMYKGLSGFESINQNLIDYYGFVWSLGSIMKNAKKLQDYKQEYGTREYLLEDIVDSLSYY